jgi:hypothetical protein
VSPPGHTDRRPLAFLIFGVTALAAVAWTPLKELRGSLAATEYARAIAVGDSAQLAQLSPAGVRSGLCAFRETDVRSWPWASGTAAQRGRATSHDVEYRVSVVNGRSLRVLVSPGWRPVPTGVSFDRTATPDSLVERFGACAAGPPPPGTS